MRRALMTLTLLLAACTVDTGGPVDADAPMVDDPCVTTWNDVVEQWNALTEQRDAAGAADVVVDGVAFSFFEDWAVHMGYPVSLDDACS